MPILSPTNTNYIRRYGRLHPILASFRNAAGETAAIIQSSEDSFTLVSIRDNNRDLGYFGSDWIFGNASPSYIDTEWKDSFSNENVPANGYPHADVWEEVEQWRFQKCLYKRLPNIPTLEALGLGFPTKHYVHLSVTDTEADYVAYTPSEEYGKRDRQVRLRFSKYLRKCFGPELLTDAQLSQAHTEFLAALERSVEKLHFATDPDTITRIFETRMNAVGSGCCSCMYGKFDSDTFRPYHVYANSPDVALAYMTRADEIVARSVVNVNNKQAVRIYSEDGSVATCEVFRQLLAQAGYSVSRYALLGARLCYVPEDRVPYLDGEYQEIKRKGPYWIVCETGSHIADRTDGYAGTVNRCECCGECEEDCSCSTCDCCGHVSEHGCEDCVFCENCNGCRDHDGCQCDRCEDCGEVLEPRSRYMTRCDCDRCENCNALVNNCDCEDEDEDEETETEN